MLIVQRFLPSLGHYQSDHVHPLPWQLSPPFFPGRLFKGRFPWQRDAFIIPSGSFTTVPMTTNCRLTSSSSFLVTNSSHFHQSTPPFIRERESRRKKTRRKKMWSKKTQRQSKKGSPRKTPHCGSEQTNADTLNPLSHEPGSEWQSEWANEWAQLSMQANQALGTSEWVIGASKQTNGRASSPVLTSRFLVARNHSRRKGRRRRPLSCLFTTQFVERNGANFGGEPPSLKPLIKERPMYEPKLCLNCMR